MQILTPWPNISFDKSETKEQAMYYVLPLQREHNENN